MAFCCVCGESCGKNASSVLADRDLEMLEEGGYVDHFEHVPRAKATRRVCGDCAPFAKGFADRVTKLSVMIAAGLLHLARRLFPCGVDGHPFTGADCVEAHIDSKEFKDTRHGAPDFRLDRTSLYAYGYLCELYRPRDNKSLISLCFALFFMRAVCNDAGAVAAFIEEYGLLTPWTWDKEKVRDGCIHLCGIGGNTLLSRAYHFAEAASEMLWAAWARRAPGPQTPTTVS